MLFFTSLKSIDLFLIYGKLQIIIKEKHAKAPLLLTWIYSNYILRLVEFSLISIHISDKIRLPERTRIQLIFRHSTFQIQELDSDAVSGSSINPITTKTLQRGQITPTTLLIDYIWKSNGISARSWRIKKMASLFLFLRKGWSGEPPFDVRQ